MGKHNRNLSVRRTRFVTWPRSGHHWLIRMLKVALGARLRYSEYYKNKGQSLENNSRINAQKNHDFDLDLKMPRTFYHLVQIRDFQPSCRSFYKMHQDEGREMPDYSSFEAEQFEIYTKWRSKWTDKDVPNRLIVRYEELCMNPVIVVKRVLMFMVRGIKDEDAMEMAKLAVEAHPPKVPESPLAIPPSA